jgi:PAS domain S-box-containing protein
MSTERPAAAAPAGFIDDDNDRARAVLRVIITSGFWVCVAYAAMNLVLDGPGRPVTIAVVLGTALALAWAVLRVERVRATAVGVVAALLGAGAAGTWASGVEGSSTLALLLAIVLAGFTLGARASVATGILCLVIFVGVLVFAPAPVIEIGPTQQGTGVVLQLIGGTFIVVAAVRASDSILLALRAEQRALHRANTELGARVRQQEALAALGRLLVEGDDVDDAFAPALVRLHNAWGRPVALFVRGEDTPVAAHSVGFRAAVLVGGNDAAAQLVAEEAPGFCDVVDGGQVHRCRVVTVRTGSVPHGLLVGAVDAGDAGDGDARVVDDALLVGAASLFAAAFEWRQAEDRLRAAEKRRAALVSASPDALLILDEGGAIVDANPAALTLFSVASGDNMLGRSLASLEGLSADDLRLIARGLSDAREAAKARRRSGEQAPIALTLHGTTTAHIEMRVTYAPGEAQTRGRFDVSLHDVTGRVEARRTRQRLEQQLYAARRLEALGQLAGGVAHDFNNLLSVILTNARLLAEKPGLDDVTQADLQEIVDCGKRAADLTSQLLTFARQQRREPKVTDLAGTVRGLEKLLRRLTPTNVDLEFTLQKVWLVVADPAQLEQVLVNLVANARDAMPDGGTCRVSLKNVEARADRLPPGLLEPGRYVELEVSDTGHGMDDETKSHVFEPFFTTKPTGKGSGLGLATVYGIVRQSGGHIHVESAPGRGTTFRVWLPERETLIVNEEETPAAGGAISLKRERVLVIDDDIAVRRATERALESRGFRVVGAGSADEALLVAVDDLDAVVADLVMPGLQGDALVERLRAAKVRLPAVLLTGYGRRSVDLARPFRMLRKPASPEELARTLRSVIDEAALGDASDA